MEMGGQKKQHGGSYSVGQVYLKVARPGSRICLLIATNASKTVDKNDALETANMTKNAIDKVNQELNI